jgi:hypothetical protein
MTIKSQPLDFAVSIIAGTSNSHVNEQAQADPAKFMADILAKAAAAREQRLREVEAKQLHEAFASAPHSNQ